MTSCAMEHSFYAIDLREFTKFRSLIHRHTGIWLRDGKHIMLASRLSRRLRYHGMTSFADYYDYVERTPDDGEELRQLINCVTTNKTSFFRERHHFDFLAESIVPEILSTPRNGGRKSIRVWSAACSTGEEPYSIAITLLEALRADRRCELPTPVLKETRRMALPGFSFSRRSCAVEISASDIDTGVLDTAARAIYDSDALASVDRPLWSKYFLRGRDDMLGHVKVKRDVTSLVEFQRINLMDPQWPLEDLFDVIFFRNALIYFKRETQDVFLRRMIRYLKPKGYLFLGNAEHIPWLHDILEPMNHTMYRLRSR